MYMFKQEEKNNKKGGNKKNLHYRKQVISICKTQLTKKKLKTNVIYTVMHSVDAIHKINFA